MKKCYNVSIIIPVYNVRKYLCECLNSVINQTYPKIEIILVDDGSTDGSSLLCDEYEQRDERITVIHQKNKGLGNARNVGIRNAHGKYVLFIDSDDFIASNTVEYLVDVAEKNRLDIVLFSAVVKNEGKVTDSIIDDYQHTIGINVVMNGVNSYIITSQNHEYFTSVCMRFYRLDYIIDNSFRFDEEIIHEDESFSFLTYVNAKRVMCIEERFYIRRVRAGSIMTSKTSVDSLNGYAVALKSILKYGNKNKKLKYKYAYRKQIVFYMIIICDLLEHILCSNYSFFVDKSLIDKIQVCFAQARNDAFDLCFFLKIASHNVCLAVILRYKYGYCKQLLKKMLNTY